MDRHLLATYISILLYIIKPINESGRYTFQVAKKFKQFFPYLVDQCFQSDKHLFRKKFEIQEHKKFF